MGLPHSPTSLSLQLFLLYIFQLLLSHLPYFFMTKPKTALSRPSPSLVPLPLHIIIDSLKKKISVTQYMEKRDSSELCVVCLDVLKVTDEIRDLCNCIHVFHVKCLDAWMGEGQLSCPLCRAKLVADNGGAPNDTQFDPWRKERMVYLFGEDYHLMDSSSSSLFT